MALLILIIVVCVMVFIYEISGMIVMGSPPKDEDVLEALKINKKISLNMYDNNIIYIGNMPYIAKHHSLIAKYYINDVGIIPCWYKSHKIIDKLFKEHKMTKRKKLGL